MNFFHYLNRALNSSRSLLLFVSFAGFFFTRTCLTPLAYDDYAYSFIWDGEHGGNLDAMQSTINLQRIESFSDIFQSMWSHYHTWGGRIFSHTLAQFFLWTGKPIFDLANTLIFILLIVVIINLANTWLKISRIALIWIFLGFTIFAESSVMSEFWLTGACNYLWMSFFQLFFLTPYVKALRSQEASTSTLNVVLMIFLGFLAGCSNEAGALATIFITIIMVVNCYIKKIFRSWMLGGLISSCIGCAIMLFAPGNFARLAFAHPNFDYTIKIFFHNLTIDFYRVLIPDLIALLPVFLYFLQRESKGLNVPEKFMLLFAATGLLVPIIMLFAPEFNTRISITSIVFVLVSSTSAILELERINFTLSSLIPKIFLRGISITLVGILLAYLVTLIYGDISIFNAARRQVRYIERNTEFDPIIMPIMPLRHRFEKIHGERSAVEELNFFAGITADPNYYMNRLVAKYYGVSHVVAEDN